MDINDHVWASKRERLIRAINYLKDMILPTTSIIRRFNFLILVFFVLACLISILNLGRCVDGSDSTSYVSWAEVFKRLDIFQINTRILSLQNVPFEVHSFGPGLIFYLSSFFTSSIQHAGIYVIGVLFCLIFWVAFCDLLFWACHGNRSLVIFGAAVAFLGTHLGYYSFSFGPEVLANAGLAVGLQRLLARDKIRTVDALFIGVLMWFLVIIRIEMILYCFLLTLVLTGRSMERRSALRLLAHWALAVAPLSIGLIQVGIANRWMTGSFFVSPYSYGFGEFKSMDFGKPEFFAVFFHPFHGFLSYHPLYALGIAGAVMLIFFSKYSREKWFWTAALFIFVLQVYVYASWWIWWLGTNTFGMRGLGISAVLFVPALVRLLFILYEKKSPAAWVVMFLVSACCVWSLTLLTGLTTQFYTYSSLLLFQWERFKEFVNAETLSSFVLTSALAVFVFKKNSLEPQAAALFILNCFLVFLITYFLFSCGHWIIACFSYTHWVSRRLSLDCPKWLLGWLDLIRVFLVSMTPFWVNQMAYPRTFSGTAFLKHHLNKVIAVLFFLIFVVSTVRFWSLTSAVEPFISGMRSPGSLNQFYFRGNLDVNGLITSCAEFTKVTGYKEKKKTVSRFISFLLRQRYTDKEIQSFIESYT